MSTKHVILKNIFSPYFVIYWYTSSNFGFYLFISVLIDSGAQLWDYPCLRASASDGKNKELNRIS